MGSLEASLAEVAWEEGGRGWGWDRVLVRVKDGVGVRVEGWANGGADEPGLGFMFQRSERVRIGGRVRRVKVDDVTGLSGGDLKWFIDPPRSPYPYPEP